MTSELSPCSILQQESSFGPHRPDCQRFEITKFESQLRWWIHTHCIQVFSCSKQRRRRHQCRHTECTRFESKQKAPPPSLQEYHHNHSSVFEVSRILSSTVWFVCVCVCVLPVITHFLWTDTSRYPPPVRESCENQRVVDNTHTHTTKQRQCSSSESGLELASLLSLRLFTSLCYPPSPPPPPSSSPHLWWKLQPVSPSLYCCCCAHWLNPSTRLCVCTFCLEEIHNPIFSNNHSRFPPVITKWYTVHLDCPSGFQMDFTVSMLQMVVWQSLICDLHFQASALGYKVYRRTRR